MTNLILSIKTFPTGSLCVYFLISTQGGDKTFFFVGWNPLLQLFTALQWSNSVTTDVHCLHAEAMQLYTVFIHWTQTQHSCVSFPFPMSLNWTHKTCQSPINLNLCQWQVSPSTWQVWYIKMLIKTACLFSLCNTVSTVETFWSLGSNVYTCLRSCGSSSPEQSSSLFPAPPSLPGCGSDTTLNTLLLPTGHDADEQLHQPHLVNNKCVYIICRLIHRMYIDLNTCT